MKPVENIHYWRSPDIAGLETCRVIDSKHSFPNHSHESIFALGIMEQGGAYCAGYGKEYGFMEQGDIALINPGQIHSGVPVTDKCITYRMLYLEIDLMNRIARDIFEDDSLTPEFADLIVRDKTLATLLKLLCSLMTNSQSILELDSVIFETVSTILENYGDRKRKQVEPKREHRAVKQAKEFLSENVEAKISLEEVSKAVGLSQYHFLRTFKRATGLSPHVYRTQQRLEKAKQMLKKGIPLAEIALATGFNDQSHFNNKFRQFTAATPHQYLSRYSA